MNLRLNRSLQIFYALVITLSLGIAGYGAYYFWQNGPFDSENITTVYEASLQLDELKKKKYVANIKKQVENDRVRDAVRSMENFERKARNLNTIKSVEAFESLSKKLNQNKKYLNGLLNYPELSTVILILGNKVANFESFVVQNRWRTLTRMSRRIKAKLSVSRVRTPGFFNHKKLSNLHKSITRDLNTMKSVTSNSVLTATNKRQILTNLKTLDTELNMLKRFLNSLDDFNASYKAFNGAYSDWMMEIEPAVALNKIELEKNNQKLLMGFVSLLGFWALALVLGYFVYRGNRKSIRKEIESVTLRTIKDGIIPFESKIDYPGTEIFNREVLKYREYVHKRMSFGSVFQDAVPFSCILLDSNLNVVWANELFYSTWDLNGTDKDGNVSWDYLQRFTNLGEDDPVLMAHGQGIAGIYQIQVKRNADEDTLPYEMYVSPVDYGGQKRIMIFFYPLTSLEETIHNQTKSIVGPVSRTLDALATSGFNPEFQTKVENDFEVAGIGEIYDKFQNYNSFVTQQKHGLLTEIENLENKVLDLQQMIATIREFQTEKGSGIENAIESFQTSRNTIVHNIDLRYELEDNFQSTLNTARNILKEENSLLERSKKAGTIIEENIRAFESVSKTKDDFKVLRDKVDDFKGRLSQSIEQTLLFLKREGADQRLEQSLSRIKLEMKGVEQVFSAFGEVVKNLDIGLSKIGLIINESEVPDFTDFQGKLESAREEIENLTFHLGRVSRSGERSDELMVQSLKELYAHFQNVRGLETSLNTLVAEAPLDYDGIQLGNFDGAMDVAKMREEQEIEVEVELTEESTPERNHELEL